jgi:hypothetical protein
VVAFGDFRSGRGLAAEGTGDTPRLLSRSAACSVAGSPAPKTRFNPLEGFVTAAAPLDYCGSEPQELDVWISAHNGRLIRGTRFARPAAAADA